MRTPYDTAKFKTSWHDMLNLDSMHWMCQTNNRTNYVCKQYIYGACVDGRTNILETTICSSVFAVHAPVEFSFIVGLLFCTTALTVELEEVRGSCGGEVNHLREQLAVAVAEQKKLREGLESQLRLV